MIAIACPEDEYRSKRSQALGTYLTQVVQWGRAASHF